MYNIFVSILERSTFQRQFELASLLHYVKVSVLLLLCDWFTWGDPKPDDSVWIASEMVFTRLFASSE